MWTPEVLEKIEGKTILSAEPNYAGDQIYEIVLTFTDNSTVVIDTEHHPDHPLRARLQ